MWRKRTTVRTLNSVLLSRTSAVGSRWFSGIRGNSISPFVGRRAFFSFPLFFLSNLHVMCALVDVLLNTAITAERCNDAYNFISKDNG